jgi:hypothetical protein
MKYDSYVVVNNLQLITQHLGANIINLGPKGLAKKIYEFTKGYR